ncbi:hypothetical protein A8F94_15735 [Bacillus sp. FJAT-27225]|uniref:hypothetical protein n=1 Tax=Bacillus sp. FJAT-27225 TaxID=1743144 RepID=UPI00080C3001|nr:hypothetical protein [Bacillus sp. FJAT-27225]OCA84171.1 hypothetical protein A8F94_15735 [Bacillus sp. FJAT-27225]
MDMVWRLFYIRAELISDRGTSEAENKQLIVNDIKTFLSEVKENEKYKTIDGVTLTVDQYSRETGNTTAHRFIQGDFKPKKLKKKDISKLSAGNIRSYFDEIDYYTYLNKEV